MTSVLTPGMGGPGRRRLIRLTIQSLRRPGAHTPPGVAPLLLGLALLIGFPGCAPREPRADIVIINGGEPETLDPAICTGQPDGRVAAGLWEGLTRTDPSSAEPQPAIAERWEISPDGRVYTFHLRTNAVWSTGEPITAEDVVYSWRRVVNPATAADYAGQLFFVRNGEEIASGKISDPSRLGVEALDPHRLRVELVEPTAFFLDLCAFRTLAVVPRKTIERYGDRWLLAKPLPTSGPYTLEAWRVNDKIRLRRNPRHWDAANIRNEVIDMIHLESAMTSLNLFERHQADIIWDKTLIPMELVDILRTRPYTHTFNYLATYFVRFNVTRPPFNDVRVRRALAMAVDKRRITTHIMHGGERVASAIVPPGTAGYEPPDGLPYDPAEARRLLAEAGYPGGKGFPPFEYLTNTARQHEQVAVELQEMWKRELGITMELHNTEWKVFLADQSRVNFDLSRSSWVGDYNDPNTFLDMFMSSNGNNRTGWKNPRYDELMKQGNALTDRARRAALLREAERILVEQDLPVLPLFFYVGITLYRPEEYDGIYPNMIDEHPMYCIGRKGAARP
ncbi:MAG TPA: peptide ABC transporter substrate-binding protein [Verrucomicrobiales bacterium]|nr:peptide ABC transporter substrate-binding protein [Verrucomicrobiales bacterium]